jgi:2-oxoglutarate dehydrogenase E2 component (dihydrolipoamide succinyltransferase)
LVNEEDTVTVGQDLLRIEPGGAPEGAKSEKADSTPKEPASSEQPTSSDPKPSMGESKPKEESSPPPPPPQEKKPEPKKESPPPKQTESKSDGKQSSSSPVLGSREERRVCRAWILGSLDVTNKFHRLR